MFPDTHTDVGRADGRSVGGRGEADARRIVSPLQHRAFPMSSVFMLALSWCCHTATGRWAALGAAASARRVCPPYPGEA